MELRKWLFATALAVSGVLAWVAMPTSTVRHEVGQASAQYLQDKALRRPPPTPPASLRIDGDVAVSGLASGTATLVLRVGQNETTQSIALPAYSVTVAQARPTDMVSLEILTGDAKYASILGSYGRLSRKAGADEVLTPDELDRVRITAMGTSLHYFVTRELGDRLPVSDREHERAIRSVGTEVAVAGSVLEALATGDVQLPSGYAHGYALLQDQPGYRLYLREQPEAMAGYGDFMAAPSGIRFSPLALAPAMAIMGDVAFGEPAVSHRGARVIMRTREGYEHYGWRSAPDARADIVAVDDETLRLTLREPAYHHAYSFRSLQPGAPPVQVLTRYTQMHETYRRHFVGDRYSLWGVTDEYEVTFPDNPELAPERSISNWMGHAFALDDMALRFTASDVIDRRTLPYFCVAPDVGGQPIVWDCDHAQTTFIRDGSGIVQELGAKVDANMQPRLDGFGTDFFQWNLGPRGRLQLRSYQSSVTYWRIDEGDAASDAVIYVAKKQDGADTLAIAGQTAMLDARIEAGFEAIDPLGTWRYATFEQGRDLNSWNTVPVDTTFVRSANGISLQHNVWNEEPVAASTIRSGWQILEIPIYFQDYERLYDTRYRGDGFASGQIFASCEEAYAAGATLCSPDQVRYFRPMTSLDNRLYGIEDLYQNVAGIGQVPYFYRYSRPTYYEKVSQQQNSGRGSVPRSWLFEKPQQRTQMLRLPSAKTSVQ